MRVALVAAASLAWGVVQVAGCGPWLTSAPTFRCPAGQYQSPRSDWACCGNCPAGRYTDRSNLDSSCRACEAGRYQPSSRQSSCSNCPAGKYQPYTARTSCYSVSSGYYATSGSASQTRCPQGRYGSGSSTSSSCTGCVAAGRYYPYTGNTASSPGYYCSAGRYGSGCDTSSSCTGACPRGYYCPSGTRSGSWIACTSTSGRYCPEGSGSPSTVSSGYYGGPEGESRHYYQTRCPRGYYCSSGRRYACPAGRYGSSEGLTSSTCNGVTPAGTYAPAGSVEPKLCADSKTTPEEWYCPAGAGAPYKVPAGYYSTPEDGPVEKRTGVAKCEDADGVICVAGKRVPAIEFTDAMCKSGGTGVLNLPENQGGPTVGTLTAKSNDPAAGAMWFQRVSLAVPSSVPASCGLTPTAISVDSAGALTLGPALDHESCTGNNIVLRVRANAGSLYRECTLTIKTVDTNEAPVLNIASGTLFQVYENAALHTTVGLPIQVTDPDGGDEVAFAITSATPASGSSTLRIGSCSGQITVAEPSQLSATARPTYVLTITVTDLGGLTDQETITVEVLDVNDPPAFANTTFYFAIDENPGTGAAVGTALLGYASDPDADDTMTFSFQTGSNADESYAIDGASGLITVANAAKFNYETRASLSRRLTVKVTDREGLSDTAEVQVTLNDVNEAPTLSAPGSAAGDSCSISENSPIGTPVCSIAASDEDLGQAVGSFVLITNPSSRFAIDATTGAITVASAGLDYEATAAYTVRVGASDDAPVPIQGTRDFTINVVDVNEAPSVAPVSVTVDENLANVQVTTSPVVSDPEGNNVFYQLGDDQLANTFAINSTTGAVRVLEKLNHETKDSYTITVRVTDDGSPPRSSTFVVTLGVNDVNEAPTVPSGQRLYLLENSVGAFGSINGSDVDEGATWTWELVDNTERFVLSAEGEFSVNPSWTGNDFEGEEGTGSPTELPHDHNARMLRGLRKFVHGEHLEELAAHMERLAVSEGVAPELAAVSARRLLAQTGRRELHVNHAPSDPGFVVRVKITDQGGLSSTGAILVWLEDVPEAPEWTITTISMPETTTGQVGVGRVFSTPLTARDDDAVDRTNVKIHWLTGANGTLANGDGLTTPDGAFSIEPSTGKVTVVTASFVESQQTHTYWAQASDTQGHKVQAEVTLAVTEQNDPPVFDGGALQNIDLSESAGAGTPVVTASCSDADSGQVLTYRIDAYEPASAGWRFAIDSSTGAITGTIALFDYESAENVFTLNVSCTDNGPGTLSDSASLVISLTDAPEAPTLDNMDDVTLFMTIPENSAEGTTTKDVDGNDVIPATDQDGGVLTWSLSATTTDNQEHPFTISNGVISLAPGGELNYEDTLLYAVTVTVTDPTGLSDSGVVNINVLDVNERPATTNQDISLSEAEATTSTVVAVIAGTDPDSDILSYTIQSGNDHSLFRMSGSNLVLAAPLDYEFLGSHTVQVNVSDPGGLYVLSTIAVTVEDVNDIAVANVTGVVEHTTAGGEWVVFTGTNVVRAWGSPVISATYTNQLRTRYTSPACEVVSAPSSVRCQTAVGVGGPLTWTLTVDGNVYKVTTATTTYKMPTLDVVNGAAEMNTTGGAMITLSGLDFGPAGTPFVVEYGPSTDPSRYRAVECAVATAHLLVRCKSVAGGGGGLTWRINAGGLWSEWVAAGAYQVPSIAGMMVNATRGARGTPAEVPLTTVGGDLVTLVGQNFGPATETLWASYGEDLKYRVRCRHSAANPHTEVVCPAAAGSGMGHQWIAELVDQQSAASSQATSYLPPSLRLVDGPGASDASTAGGDVVFLSGAEFGPANAAGVPLAVRYGPLATAGAGSLGGGGWYAAENCRVTTSHSLIECITAPGVGKDHAWVVELDGQVSRVLAANTSYHPPVIAVYSGAGSADARTRGGQEVLIDGRHFGPAGTEVERVLYGAVEKVTDAAPGELFEATNCVLTRPHRTISCDTIVGAGTDLKWFVTIGGQVSESPSTYYARPEITGFTGAGASNARTAGGDSIVIQGTNFATQDFLGGVTYGPTGTEYKARDCAVLSHENITCTLAPGVGRALRWVVNVGGTSSVPSTATTSYAAPTIVSVTPGTDLATGGQTVVVRARNIGFRAGASVAVKYNPLGVNTLSAATIEAAWAANRMGQHWDESVSRWLDELASPQVLNAPGAIVTSSLEDPQGILVDLNVAMPEGYGVDRDFFLAVTPAVSGTSSGGAAVTPGDGSAADEGGAMAVWSDRLPLTYAEPMITRLAPDRQGVEASELRVIVQGTNFCKDTSCGIVWAAGTPIQAVLSWTHTEIIFVISDPTEDGAAEVVVEVAGRRSNAVIFDRPVPNFNALEGQGAWEDIPTRGGEGFYLAQVLDISTVPVEELAVWIGPNKCDQLQKRADVDIGGSPTVRLECILPPGVGDSNDVVIDVRDGAALSRADFMFVQYSAPSVDRVLFVPADGSPTRVVYPQPDIVGEATASPTMSTATRTALSNPMPDGSVYGGVPTMGADMGSIGSIVIEGNDFGTEALGSLSGTVEMVGPITPAAAWNHSEVWASMPSGAGKGYGFRVEVGHTDVGFQTSLLVPIRFSRPRILNISPASAPTAGGSVITLTGTDFGPANVQFPEPSIQIGGLPCPLVQGSASHTSVQCTLPAAQGRELDVVMISNGQASNMPDNGAPAPAATFSYDQPVIEWGYPLHGPTSGRTRFGEPILLTLRGSNFGTGTDGAASRVIFQTASANGAPATVVASVASNDALAVRSWNHTTIVVEMPAGFGTELDVVVQAGGQTSVTTTPSTTAALSFSYDPPSVLGWSRTGAGFGPEDCVPITRPCSFRSDVGRIVCPRPISRGCYPTVGGYWLEISGESFGASGARVMLGDTVCPTAGPDESSDLQQTHNRVVCKVPPGFGDRVRIHVTAGTGAAARTNAITPAAMFAYDAPEVQTLRPNNPDARGERIEILGSNFGGVATPVDIRVEDPVLGSQRCTDAEWLNDNRLACNLPLMTVGAKNLSILVANRSEAIVFNDWEETLVTECQKGLWYGLEEELCLECETDAVGGNCTTSSWSHADTLTSLPGWWRFNISSTDARCHALRQDTRDRKETGDGFKCPFFAPCEPNDACVGNNLCSVGYEGDRCGQCLKGEYYRLNGLCEKCPDNPWMIFVLLFLAACAAALGGYVLNSKQVNIGMVSIGTDYFQVLALFAKTRVEWPPLLRSLFTILSAFNLNLELAAPECLAPNVSVETKFFLGLALPVVILTLLAIGNAGVFFFRLLVQGRHRKEAWNHSHTVVSMSVILSYFMYMFFARLVFDVLNCSPSDPPDGHMYMSGMTDVECWVSPVHVLMVPFALVGILVYVVGFPVWAYFLLRTNKVMVKTDQILRAMGVEDVRAPQMAHLPELRVFRRRFHRLYYLFKPGKWYWITYLIGRKAAIAVAALLFRGTPGYQMAIMLLVLFTSYALQVRQVPFMSPGDHESVVRDHQLAASIPGKMNDHTAAEAIIRSGPKAELRGNVASTFAAAVRAKVEADESSGKVDRNVVASFLIDYNAVESVLLGCGILVNLAGTMFLSERFSPSRRSLYQGEYDGLASLTAAIIIISIIYFFFVFFIELLFKFNPEMAGRLCSCLSARARKKGKAAAAGKGGAKPSAGASVDPDEEAEPGAVTFETNTLVSLRSDDAASEGAYDTMVLPRTAPKQGEWESLRLVIEQLKSDHTTMAKELRDVRSSAMVGAAAGSGAATGPGATAAAGGRGMLASFAARGAQGGSRRFKATPARALGARGGGSSGRKGRLRSASGSSDGDSDGSSGSGSRRGLMPGLRGTSNPLKSAGGGPSEMA